MISKKKMAAEFARRAVKFYKGIDPMKINLWGLFRWCSISHWVKRGDVILNDGYSKINKVVWCRPSQEFYNKDIQPLLDLPLDDLSAMAGWESDFELKLHN